MNFLLKFAKSVTNSAGIMLAFSNIARAVSYVIPLPVLYYQLDTVAVAYWLLISTIVAMQNIFFLGLPQVLVRQLSYANARLESSEQNIHVSDDDDTDLYDICQFMAVLFNVLSVLLILGLLTFGTWSLVKTASGLSNINDGWGSWAVVALFSLVRVHSLRQLTFLNGMADIAFPRMIDGAAWMIGGVAGAFGLLTTHSLTVLAIAANMPSLVAVVLLGMRCRKHGWHIYSRNTNWERFRKTASVIWTPTWRTGLGTLLSAGARQGTGLIFAQVGKSELVAAYLLAQNVITLTTLLSSAPIMSKLHAAARANANDKRESVSLLLRKGLEQSLWVVVAICGGAAIVVYPTLHFIGRDQAFVSPLLWAVMGFTLFLQRYGAAHLQFYSTSNHIIWHWLDGFTGLINIAVSLALVHSVGLWAIVFGNFVSIAFFYVWIPPIYSHNYFKMKWPITDLLQWLYPFFAWLCLTVFSFLL